MFEYYQTDRYVLSSSCPYSRSIIAFALRLGGIVDPEFIRLCDIADKSFKKKVDELKQIPLKYEPSPSAFNNQEELFLDIDLSNKMQFYDSWQFKNYNPWLNDQHQWDSIDTFDEDLVI